MKVLKNMKNFIFDNVDTFENFLSFLETHHYFSIFTHERTVIFYSMRSQDHEIMRLCKIYYKLFEFKYINK